MINIFINSPKIQKAAQTFSIRMKILLENRLNIQIRNYPTNTIFDFLQNNIQEILVEKPNRLIEFSNNLNNLLALPGNQRYKETISKIFNYDWFIKKTNTRYNAYDLAKAIDVNVCVYCNRNYTHTIITKDGRKITRPSFDHFFNKADHPLLALSFYNLIPSCSICNSGIKHSAKFQLTTHKHPYLDNYIDDFVFSYEPTGSTSSNLKVLIKSTDEKTRRTLNDLKTELIYNSHTQELKELIDMRYKFSDNYLKILNDKVLSSIILSPNELYKLAFGSEMQKEEFGNRPFSKFKHDILKELGII